MAMEKRGIVDGEGETPVKEAADCDTGCCGQCKPIGTDPMSKMAETVVETVVGGITRRSILDALRMTKDK